MATLDAQAARLAREAQERELKALQERRVTEELKFREGLAAKLEFAQRQVRELVTALKERDSAKEAFATAKVLAARLAEQESAARTLRGTLSVAKAPAGPMELRVGGRVHHLEWDKDAEVISLAGEEAVVAAAL